jgi:HK97 family phage portal protein
MKFSRAEIASIYNIPLYKLDGYATNNDSRIEEQTLEFRSNTIAPILDIYKNELEFKLLTERDIDQEVEITYNTDVLISADLKTLTNSLAMQVSKGLASPNEAIKKLGNQTIDSEYGDYHYQQQQNIAIEHFDKQNINANNKDIKNNKDNE